MLETLIVLLFLMWMLGYGFHVGGDFVHLLLILCLAVLVVRIATGRRL